MPGPDTRWTALAQLIPGIAVQPDNRQKSLPSTPLTLTNCPPDQVPPSPCTLHLSKTIPCRQIVRGCPETRHSPHRCSDEGMACWQWHSS